MRGPDAGADAAGFISTARNLLAGDGFVMHYGVDFAPVADRVPYFRDAMPGFSLALALIGPFAPIRTTLRSISMRRRSG